MSKRGKGHEGKKAPVDHDPESAAASRAGDFDGKVSAGGGVRQPEDADGGAGAAEPGVFGAAQPALVTEGAIEDMMIFGTGVELVEDGVATHVPLEDFVSEAAAEGGKPAWKAKEAARQAMLYTLFSLDLDDTAFDVAQKAIGLDDADDAQCAAATHFAVTQMMENRHWSGAALARRVALGTGIAADANDTCVLLWSVFTKVFHAVIDHLAAEPTVDEGVSQAHPDHEAPAETGAPFTPREIAIIAAGAAAGAANKAVLDGNVRGPLMSDVLAASAILDESPDIPASALGPIVKKPDAPIAALEALKATYVGMAQWVKAEDEKLRLADEAKTRLERRPTRYEKAGREDSAGAKNVSAAEHKRLVAAAKEKARGL